MCVEVGRVCRRKTVQIKRREEGWRKKTVLEGGIKSYSMGKTMIEETGTVMRYKIMLI